MHKAILVVFTVFCSALFADDGLSAFMNCASGSAISVSNDCDSYDLDGDGDVDQVDFGIFQAGMGTPISTAKPLVAELDGAHALAGSIQCFCPIIGGELLPRDMVGNVMAEPFAGGAYSQTGPLPDLVADGFTECELSESAYRFKAGSSAFILPGRGWSTTAANRTVFAAMKIRNTVDTTINTHTIAIAGSGSDNSFHGIAVQLNNSGTITLGLYRSQSFLSSGLKLEADKWYAIAITITGTAIGQNRVFRVYDFAAKTVQSATVPDTVAYAAGTSGNAVINAMTGSVLWTGTPEANTFIGDIAAFGLDGSAWNDTTFQSFCNDPWSLARGTYAPSGALTAGSVSSASTATGIVLAACRPTGGTAPYSYQWYRGTVCSFTPGAETILPGANSAIHVDATPELGVVYFYRCVITDSAAASVTPVQVMGSLFDGERYVGLVGDSLLASSRVGRHLTRIFHAHGWRVGVCNRAKGGSSTYTTSLTNSWQPSSIQPGTTLFDNALRYFQAAGVQDVIIELGTNDVSSETTVENFQAYLGNICNAFVAAGMRVFLVAAPLSTSHSEYRQWLLQQYQHAYANLANGTTIFYITSDTYRITAAFKRAMHSDLLHYQFPDMFDEVVAGIMVSGCINTAYAPF